jgi:hypothetical protein
LSPIWPYRSYIISLTLLISNEKHVGGIPIAPFIDPKHLKFSRDAFYLNCENEVIKSLGFHMSHEVGRWLASRLHVNFTWSKSTSSRLLCFDHDKSTPTICWDSLATLISYFWGWHCILIRPCHTL